MSLCRKEFKSKEGLNYHIENFHEESEKINCEPNIDHSIKQEFIENNVKEEEKEIPQEKPKFFHRSHPCQLCSKTFKSKLILNYHKKSVHDVHDEKNCEKCDKTFKHKRNLIDHIKSVHEGIRSDPCQFCGKDFITEKRLKEHMASVHNDNRDHNCENCGKTFKKRQHLIRH